MRTPLQNWGFILLFALAYVAGGGAIVYAVTILFSFASGEAYWLLVLMPIGFIVWGFTCGRWARRVTGWGVTAGVWTGMVPFALVACYVVISEAMSVLSSASSVHANIFGMVFRIAASLVVYGGGLIVPPTLGARYEGRERKPAPAPSSDA